MVYARSLWLAIKLVANQYYSKQGSKIKLTISHKIQNTTHKTQIEVPCHETINYSKNNQNQEKMRGTKFKHDFSPGSDAKARPYRDLLKTMTTDHMSLILTGNTHQKVARTET